MSKKVKKSNWETANVNTNMQQNVGYDNNICDIEEDSVPRQLPPIIQPIAIVPYSTQNQPLLQELPGDYVDDGYAYGDYAGADYDYEDNQDYAPVAVRKGKVKEKKGNGFASFLLLLLSIVSLAVIVVGKFVQMDYFFLYGMVNGLDTILNVAKSFDGAMTDMMLSIGLIVLAVANIVTIILAIVGMKKGINAFTKIVVFLGLAGAVVALVMVAQVGALAMGSYILVGVAFVELLVALLVKNK